MMNKQVSSRTYLITIVAIVIVALSSIAYVRSTSFPDDQTDLYLNPPFGEASYVIGQYDATYYYLKNVTTGKYDYLSTSASSVINSAIGNLSGTVVEKIVLKGDFSLRKYGTCKGYDYCILINKDRVWLDLTQANLTLADAQDATMIIVDDPLIANSSDASYEEAISEVSIIGGKLNGNKAMQTGTGDGIMFNYTRKSVLRDTYVVDCADDDLRVDGYYYTSEIARFSVENDFYNLKLYTADQRGLYTIEAADNHYENIYIQKCEAEGAYIYCSSNQFFNLHVYDCCLSSGQGGIRVSGKNNHFWHTELDKPTTRGIYLESSVGCIFQSTWIFELDASTVYNAVSIINSNYTQFLGGRIQSSNITETGTFSDYNTIIGLDDTDGYIRSLGTNTHINLCWNHTTWIP